MVLPKFITWYQAQLRRTIRSNIIGEARLFASFPPSSLIKSPCFETFTAIMYLMLLTLFSPVFLLVCLAYYGTIFTYECGKYTCYTPCYRLCCFSRAVRGLVDPERIVPPDGLRLEVEPVKEEISFELDQIREDRLTCIVCKTEPINTVLVPCCHGSFCQACSRRLSTCPICRRFIEFRLQIFI